MIRKFTHNQAIEMVTDLARDLSRTPPFGYTLSQDDAWEIAEGLKVLIEDIHASDEEHRAWQETREGMNRQ